MPSSSRGRDANSKTCVYGHINCFEMPVMGGDGGASSSQPAASGGTILDRIKQAIGLDAECQNGGVHLANNKCQCQFGYIGQFCEIIDCRNNSTAKIGPGEIPGRPRCDCPDPHFGGNLCERLTCENNGTPVRDHSECECLQGWYTGQFCEEYSAPWMYIFAGVGVGVLLLVLLCMYCQLRSYAAQARRPAHPRRRPRHAVPRADPERGGVNSRPAMLQLHMNARGEQEMRLVPPPPAPHPPAYYEGADGEEYAKPGTPPPSYDQVLADSTRYPRSLEPTQPPSASDQCAVTTATVRQPSSVALPPSAGQPSNSARAAVDVRRSRR